MANKEHVKIIKKGKDSNPHASLAYIAPLRVVPVEPGGSVPKGIGIYVISNKLPRVIGAVGRDRRPYERLDFTIEIG